MVVLVKDLDVWFRRRRATRKSGTAVGSVPAAADSPLSTFGRYAFGTRHVWAEMARYIIWSLLR